MSTEPTRAGRTDSSLAGTLHPQKGHRTMTADIRIADLFPSRWLKAKDLIDAGQTRLVARVSRVSLEEVQPQPNEKVQRLALHLAGQKPYLVTAKADATTLAEAYQVATADQLVGRDIAIRLDTWRKQAVLRIAPPPPATAPVPKLNRPAPIPQPPATAPAPVATAAPNPAPAPPPPAAPVAPVAHPPAATNGHRSDAVELWPPREPWIARKKSGEVDWVSSFWAGSAALQVPREGARFILEHNGGSFEDACQEIWEQHLGKDRCDPAADPCPHGFASSCPEGCN